MINKGIMATELIERLKQAVEDHGDRPVMKAGSDYPEGVEGVYLQLEDKPYCPAGVLVVYG